MLRSHTKRKVICHLVKCGLRHVINNILICHICFWCVVLKYCVKTQCNCVIAITSSTSFSQRSGLYVILFLVVHNITQCTLPLPLHSTIACILYFPYVCAPQQTHYLGSNGKMICQVSCQWEEVSTILDWWSFFQSHLCHLQVCCPWWDRTSNALAPKSLLC